MAGDLNGSGWDPAAHRAHCVESSRPKVDNLARGPHKSFGNTINKSDSVGGGIPDIGTTFINNFKWLNICRVFTTQINESLMLSDAM